MTEQSQPVRHRPKPREITGFQESRTPGLPLPSRPWMPAPFDKADIAAMKALRLGEATGDQQKRALAWIVEYAARTYGNPYVPGAKTSSDVSFGCGCKHVGDQIVKLLNWRVETNDEQGR